MIVHPSLPTSTRSHAMASLDELSRSPSPVSHLIVDAYRESLAISDLSNHFSTYTIDGSPQPPKQEERNYNFTTTDEPIFFTQPDYSHGATQSSALNKSAEPPSPRAVYSPSFPPLPSPTIPSYHSMSASRIRQQRQRAVRRQCSESHLRDVSKLVARMVAQGEQCSVGEVKTPSLSRSSSTDDAASDLSHAYTYGEPEMMLDEEEDDDDDAQHQFTAGGRGRNNGSDNYTRWSSSSSGSFSSRSSRLGSRCSVADLRAQPSMRDGISKNFFRTKRPNFPTTARRRAMSTSNTVEEE